MGTCSPPTAESPFACASKSIHASLCELDDKIGRLRARLEEVMRPVGPTGTAGQATCGNGQPTRSVAVENLQQIAERIIILGWRVDDMLDRLDV